jgi:hypothetical protein
MANEDTHTSSLPELTPGSVAEDAPAPADTTTEHVPAPAPPSPRLSVVDPDPLPPVPLVEPNPVAPVRSSLVPLGSQAAAAAPAPPQPKRFSAVNINKKFLEKNSSSSSTSAPASANSTANKTGGPVCASRFLVYTLTAPIVEKKSFSTTTNANRHLTFASRHDKANRRPAIPVDHRFWMVPPLLCYSARNHRHR